MIFKMNRQRSKLVVQRPLCVRMTELSAFSRELLFQLNHREVGHKKADVSVSGATAVLLAKVKVASWKIEKHHRPAGVSSRYLMETGQ